MTMTGPSEQLKQNVVNHLCRQERVDASDVKVEVIGSQVILTGSVPTFDAKKAAFEAVLTVPGVNSIKNDISVQYPKGMAVPSDEELKADIAKALSKSPAVDVSRIEITTDYGVITLEGTVTTCREKLEVEAIVGSVSGVRDICNKMAITPAEKQEDRSIATNIMAAFDQDPNLDADAIHLQVNEGIAVLSGNVLNPFARDRAVKLAAQIEGVVDVINQLTIKSD